ncbi:MAG: hypothetical protein NVS2B16_09140 [Chloroflexota bacterium]
MPLVKRLHVTFQRRRCSIGLAVFLAVLVPIAQGITTGHADSVVLTDTYTSTTPGPSQVPIVHFPSGTTVVYFDYTVATPSSSDVGEVDVNIGSTTGPYITAAPLDLKTAGAKFVPITTTSRVYPDGAYCAILKINGVPQTIANGVPYAFTVGDVTYPFTCPNPPPDSGTPTVTPTSTATPTRTPSPTSTSAPVTPTTPTPAPTSTKPAAPPPPVSPPTSTATPTNTAVPTNTVTPTATPTDIPTSTPLPPPTQVVEESLRHFVIAISSSLHPRRFGTVRLYTHGTIGRPVSGVRIAIDPRRLGMARARRGNTNAYGIVTFAYLWPPHGGMLTIAASKPGYAPVTVELSVY